MSYLLYGDDTYRSRQKLNAIKSKYIDASLGDTNLSQIDGAKTKGDEIIRSLWTMPFLAPKRLVIIHNLISLGSKESQNTVQEFLLKIPASTVAVFYENEKIDKRNGLFKALNQPKFAQEYPFLDPFKLRQWITKKFNQAEVKAASTVIEYLIKNIGPDLWRQDNEINKLINYAPEEITLADIQNLIFSEPSGDIFVLIDSLSRRDLTAAASNLKGRLHSGDNPIYLMTMFVYGFRTLLIVEDALKRNPRAAGASGIHPLVWRKASSQIKAFNHQSLKIIYKKLRDLDYAVKTGIIDSEVALDLFIFELCLGSLKQ